MVEWFGGAAILIGLASCFYGYPLFRILLILAGLFYGYWLGESFVSTGHPWLSLIIGLGGAVLLAVLAYPLWSIGVVVIGAVLGFMLVSSVGVVLNASQGVAILLGLLGAAVLGYLFYGARDLFVILATAFNGAVLVVLGLGALFPGMILGDEGVNLLGIVTMLFLGGFGFAVQYKMFKDRRTYST